MEGIEALLELGVTLSKKGKKKTPSRPLKASSVDPFLGLLEASSVPHPKSFFISTVIPSTTATTTTTPATTTSPSTTSSSSKTCAAGIVDYYYNGVVSKRKFGTRPKSSNKIVPSLNSLIEKFNSFIAQGRGYNSDWREDPIKIRQWLECFRFLLLHFKEIEKAPVKGRLKIACGQFVFPEKNWTARGSTLAPFGHISAYEHIYHWALGIEKPARLNARVKNPNKAAHAVRFQKATYQKMKAGATFVSHPPSSLPSSSSSSSSSTKKSTIASKVGKKKQESKIESESGKRKHTSGSSQATSTAVGFLKKQKLEAEPSCSPSISPSSTATAESSSTFSTTTSTSYPSSSLNVTPSASPLPPPTLVTTTNTHPQLGSCL